MTLPYNEPLRTLVEKQLYTAECDRYTLSNLYTVLWHYGSQSVTSACDRLRHGLAHNLHSIPDLTFMAEINLVEIAERARYLGSFRQGADWECDRTDMNITAADWLHAAIHERAQSFIHMLMDHAVNQLSINLVAIAKTSKFIDPWLVGGTDPDALTEQFAKGLDVSENALGTVGRQKENGLIRLQQLKSIALWMYEGSSR